MADSTSSSDTTTTTTINTAAGEQQGSSLDQTSATSSAPMNGHSVEQLVGKTEEEEEENNQMVDDNDDDNDKEKAKSSKKRKTTTPKKTKHIVEKRATPSRSTRGKLPEYLEDYAVGEIDLRQLNKAGSSAASSSSSGTPKKKSVTPKKKPTPKRKAESSSSESESEEEVVSTPKKKTPVKKAKKVTPARNTSTTAGSSSSSTTPSRSTPSRPTNISLNNLPSDDSNVVRSRTPGNRYSEYQSSHIDYEEALRRLLAKTPGNEYKRGDVDASHWAISTLPTQECDYLDTNAHVMKKMTLKEVLQGCYYIEGNRTFKTAGEEPTIQICFCFDTTGSQINIIDDLKWKLQSMCEKLLQDVPGLYISLIAHGDYADANLFYVMKKLDFSNDIEQIVSFVQSLKGTGGLDPSECYELALKEAKTLSWAPKENAFTQRSLVVIGDDVPHTAGEYFKIDWQEECQSLFNDFHIKIHSVQCQAREHANQFYQYLADETGGKRFELKDMDSMQSMFLGLCYREAGEFQLVNPDMQHHLQGSDSAIVRPSTESEELSDEELNSIHQAIHDPSLTSVTIKGTEYEITTNDGACRFVRIGEVVYIEQNKDKKTKYAKMANEGRKITWITHKGKWGLIVDDEIKMR